MKLIAAASICAKQIKRLATILSASACTRGQVEIPVVGLQSGAPGGLFNAAGERT